MVSRVDWRAMRRAWRARAVVDSGTRAARQGLTIAEAANLLGADGRGPQR